MLAATETRLVPHLQGESPCLFSIVSSAPLLMRNSPIFPLVSYDMAKCSGVFPEVLQWLTSAPRRTKNSTTGICGFLIPQSTSRTSSNGNGVSDVEGGQYTPQSYDRCRREKGRRHSRAAHQKPRIGSRFITLPFDSRQRLRELNYRFLKQPRLFG